MEATTNDDLGEDIEVALVTSCREATTGFGCLSGDLTALTALPTGEPPWRRQVGSFDPSAAGEGMVPSGHGHHDRHQAQRRR